MRNVNYCFTTVVFIKNINYYACFPGKFISFLEAATRGISQYSKENCWPETLLKTDSNKCFPLNIVKFLRTSISKDTC